MHDAMTANNFDAVRLFAALLVLVSHHFYFLGRHQPAPMAHTLGELGVMIFFTVSGYLVAESWYRDPHVARFAMRRLLRLWPALAVASVLIALAGSAITSLPLHDYAGGAARFVVQNLKLQITFNLPGVFVTHPDSPMSAVNGSWWTIPLEAKCYVCLAVLGLIGLRRRWVSLLALVAVAFFYVKTLHAHRAIEVTRNLLFFYVGFFATGLCARQFRTAILAARRRWLGAGVAALLVALAMRLPTLAEWVIVAPATLVIGSLSTPMLRAAGRFGDLSYGIYIYAFLVQQLVVRTWPGPPSLLGSLLVAILITSALAWCSWHAVEAPALRLKRRLRSWFPDHAP